MTTTSPTAAAEAPPLLLPARTPALHRAVGWAAAAGTLPYLTLKAFWIAGGTAGMSHPSAIAGPTVIAGDALTAAADAVLTVLALALTHRWGYRLPAWLVVLPAWVGTGFLVPIAVAILPGAAMTMAATGELGDGSLAPWVGPLVYGGFAWQGAFLAAAFALHAHARWSGTVVTPPTTTAGPVLHALVGGGTALTVLSAGLHLMVDGAGALVHYPLATFALLGAAGVCSPLRGAGGPIGGLRW